MMLEDSRVYWFTGNTKAGKTVYAVQFIEWIHKHIDMPVVHLDGDVLRDFVMKDHDLTPRGRWVHNMRTARLAKVFADQGNIVVVSLICPYHALQKQVHELTNCVAIRVDGGAPNTPETPYESWENPSIVLPEYPREGEPDINWHNVFIALS